MNLFSQDCADEVVRKRLKVLPVSVVELERGDSGRRRKGEHGSTSSRQDYSHFPDEAASLACELFLRDCSLVFDPFAGWGERHAACKEHGLAYVGLDINPEAISSAAENYGVTNTLGDSRTADIPCFDGLLTCPPYWNLERYSNAGIENAKTFDLFVAELSVVFERCYQAAQVGAMFCVMIGDWRSDHVYHDLAYRVQRIFETCGATQIDEVILSRRNISKIKIMVPQAVRLGYTVKVHEKLLVFQKR